MNEIIIWPKVVGKPADFEYFIRFVITGVENGHKFSLKLRSPNMHFYDFCGKTFKNETLEQAINRELFQSFGVEKIIKYEYLIDQEYTQDNNGQEVPRVIVELELDKTQIKNEIFNNYLLIWKDKFLTLSEKVYKHPATFEYFITLRIEYGDNFNDYLVELLPLPGYDYFLVKDKEKDYISNLDYVGKVFIGETLEQAINRELKNEFEIDKIIQYSPLKNQKHRLNSFGEDFPIIDVFVKVDKEQIKIGRTIKTRFMSSIKINSPFKFKKTKEKEINVDLLLSKLENNKYSMEALDYLKYGGTLASNRFKNYEKAEIFIKKLYQLGAVVVNVIDVDTNGGFGTASLEVYLPSDISKRKKIIEMNNKENNREGFSEKEKDIGQESINFWWD